MIHTNLCRSLQHSVQILLCGPLAPSEGESYICHCIAPHVLICLLSLPHQTLINVCLNIVLANEGGMTVGDSSFHGGGGIATRQESIVTHRVSAPPIFCSAAVKLAAMQMQALGVRVYLTLILCWALVGNSCIFMLIAPQDQFSLEHICGGMSVFPTAEKTANMLLSLILPLCIRMGCGRRGLHHSNRQPLHQTLWVLTWLGLPQIIPKCDRQTSALP